MLYSSYPCVLSSCARGLRRYQERVPATQANPGIQIDSYPPRRDLLRLGQSQHQERTRDHWPLRCLLCGWRLDRFCCLVSLLCCSPPATSSLEREKRLDWRSSSPRCSTRQRPRMHCYIFRCDLVDKSSFKLTRRPEMSPAQTYYRGCSTTLAVIAIVRKYNWLATTCSPVTIEDGFKSWLRMWWLCSFARRSHFLHSVLL